MGDDNWWNVHTCAVRGTGEAYCWGTNGTRELGVPGVESCEGVFGVVFDCSSSPLRVTGRVRFASISVGMGTGTGHTCAVAVRGLSIYCWGANNRGQLGAASTETCTQASGVGDPIPCSTEPLQVSFPRGNPTS